MSDLFDDVFANPAVGAAGTAIGAAVVALWLAAAWWAYADAVRRTESVLAAYVAAAWVVLSTPLMLPLSLAIYALVRPSLAAGDSRVRRLVEALTLSADATSCPGCASAVDPSWQRCPTCATWLASPCAACGRWSAAELALCPWCGEEARSRPSAAPAYQVAPGSTVPLAVAAATAHDVATDAFAPDVAAEIPARSARLARRTGDPRVPRVQRLGRRRFSLGFDGRRLGRVG